MYRGVHERVSLLLLSPLMAPINLARGRRRCTRVQHVGPSCACTTRRGCTAKRRVIIIIIVIINITIFFFLQTVFFGPSGSRFRFRAKQHAPEPTRIRPVARPETRLPHHAVRSVTIRNDTLRAVRGSVGNEVQTDTRAVAFSPPEHHETFRKHKLSRPRRYIAISRPDATGPALDGRVRTTW